MTTEIFWHVGYEQGKIETLKKLEKLIVDIKKRNICPEDVLTGRMCYNGCCDEVLTEIRRMMAETKSK